MALFALSQSWGRYIAAEALKSYPRECCGLIEGTRTGKIIHAFAVHRSDNLATRDDEFEVDPAVHVRLMRELRGTGRQVVGCYHSHPDGTCEPSARDLAGAWPGNFVWLIVGVQRNFRPAFSAYRVGHVGFERLALVAPDEEGPRNLIARGCGRYKATPPYAPIV